MTMRVNVNDRHRDVPDGATLEALLGELGLDARAVVVERNGEVVPRGEVPGTVLADGDRLIVVRAVAGGAEPARGAGEHARRSRVAGGASR